MNELLELSKKVEEMFMESLELLKDGNKYASDQEKEFLRKIYKDIKNKSETNISDLILAQEYLNKIQKSRTIKNTILLSDLHFSENVKISFDKSIGFILKEILGDMFKSKLKNNEVVNYTIYNALLDLNLQNYESLSLYVCEINIFSRYLEYIKLAKKDDLCTTVVNKILEQLSLASKEYTIYINYCSELQESVLIEMLTNIYEPKKDSDQKQEENLIKKELAKQFKSSSTRAEYKNHTINSYASNKSTNMSPKKAESKSNSTSKPMEEDFFNLFNQGVALSEIEKKFNVQRSGVYGYFAKWINNSNMLKYESFIKEHYPKDDNIKNEILKLLKEGKGNITKSKNYLNKLYPDNENNNTIAYMVKIFDYLKKCTVQNLIKSEKAV